jgi:hypothetical protein
MGNILPDICVCKEREGKDTVKKRLKFSFYDQNVKILDYTGMLAYNKSLSELIEPLKCYIPYEAQCLKEPEIDNTHSIVKVKCLNIENSIAIYIKIIYITIGKFIIYIYNISEEDDHGILEYVCHSRGYMKKVINI